ncbi:hypothetical protein HJC23_012833 [Cyclotella cryptica]|uniref:Glutaredoxin domain-containing protein n=1 Tax=Cyclotella cryptica TaxID=29204 RepID=A0ABD3P0C4_9STRA
MSRPLVVFYQRNILRYAFWSVIADTFATASSIGAVSVSTAAPFSSISVRNTAKRYTVTSLPTAAPQCYNQHVVIFLITYCPCCTAAKQVFSGMDIPARIIELDKMDNGPEVQAALLDISGRRTVKNEFIKGKHLGGNDDSQAAARSGKLQEMLGI